MLTKILILLCGLLLLIPAEASHHHKIHHPRSTENDLRVKAKIVLISDEMSENPLFDKNSDRVTPIASITKLMTAMVTLDANLPLDEVLTVSNVKYVKSRLKPGAKFTRAQLLQLALMSSENLAAFTLAYNYPGGFDAFIQAMNDKAEELEMSKTKFFDPTGLDQRNVSTAKDLVKMVTAASTYPEIHDFTTTTSREVDVNWSKKPLQYHNTNPLISMNAWDIELSKTGYIRAAGRCLVMRTQINDHLVVVIILDSKTKKTRVSDAKMIMRWIEKKKPQPQPSTSCVSTKLNLLSTGGELEYNPTIDVCL